jgi:hypothetical protein
VFLAQGSVGGTAEYACALALLQLVKQGARRVVGGNYGSAIDALSLAMHATVVGCGNTKWGAVGSDVFL